MCFKGAGLKSNLRVCAANKACWSSDALGSSEALFLSSVESV